MKMKLKRNKQRPMPIVYPPYPQQQFQQPFFTPPSSPLHLSDPNVPIFQPPQLQPQPQPQPEGEPREQNAERDAEGGENGQQQPQQNNGPIIPQVIYASQNGAPLSPLPPQYASNYFIHHHK